MGRLSVSLLLCAALALLVVSEAAPGPIDGKVKAQSVVKRLPSPACSHLYGARCFEFVKTEYTWIDAEKNCLSKGANLASVHSDAEYQFIQDMIKNQAHGYPQTWLGASDAVQEGEWLWSDGRVFSKTNWAKGEPNNFSGKQHCVVTNYNGRKGWVDQPCDLKLFSICAADI